MIREKLEAFFEGRKHLNNAKEFKDFIFAEEIQLKVFMVMKFAKKAAVYDYVMVPNVLLEGVGAGAGVKMASNVTNVTNGTHSLNGNDESEFSNSSDSS
jgi:hypothetical protein